MTVKELIKKLEQFDENKEVKIYDDGNYETPNYVEDHGENIVIQCLHFVAKM